MIAEALQAHGYWILALGCLLEGETVLLMAGFAAHRGYLDPLAVFVIAACAGFAGDEICFWLGRRHGQRVMLRWPALAASTQRVHGLIERWHAAAIVGVRFAYGLRLAGPVLFGMSPISALRFAVFNAIGAVLWAALIGGLGWLFGQAAEAMLGEIRNIEGWLLVAIGVAVLATWLVHRRRTHRRPDAVPGRSDD